jgi:anti-sigma factor RsiW
VIDDAGTDDAGTDGPAHPARLDLGAYLIGSLAPAERAVVERHLATCERCRAELAELAPLPGLLARLDADEARHQTLTPIPDLLPRALDAVGRRQAMARRTLRRWRVGAATAAAAAVVALAAATVPALLPDTAAPAVPFSVAAGVTAAGTGSMEARGWGTAVRLDLTGLPPAAAYQAYATARDGRTEVAATWGPTPSGRAVVNGATAIQRSDLASIEVRTIDGRELLDLPC